MFFLIYINKVFNPNFKKNIYIDLIFKSKSRLTTKLFNSTDRHITNLSKNEIYNRCWNNLNFLNLKNNKLLLLNTLNYLGYQSYNKMNLNSQIPFVGVEFDLINQKWFCLGSYAIVNGSLSIQGNDPNEETYEWLAGPVHDFGFSISLYFLKVNYLKQIDTILEIIKKKYEYIDNTKQNLSVNLREEDYIYSESVWSFNSSSMNLPYLIRSDKYKPVNSLNINASNGFNFIKPTIIFILDDHSNSNFNSSTSYDIKEHIFKKHNFFSNIYTTFDLDLNYIHGSKGSDCLIISLKQLYYLFEIFTNELISITLWSYLLKNNLNKKYTLILDQQKKFINITNTTTMFMHILLTILIFFLFLIFHFNSLLNDSFNNSEYEFKHFEKEFNWSKDYVQKKSQLTFRYSDNQVYSKVNRRYLEYYCLTPTRFLNHKITNSYLNFFGQVTKILIFEFRYILNSMFTAYYFKLFTDKEKYFLFHFIKFVITKYMNILNELNQTKIFNNLYVKVNNESIIFPKIFKFSDARLNQWYKILPMFNQFYEKSSNCIHNTSIWNNYLVPSYYVFYNNKSDFTLIYNHVQDVIKILIDNFIVPVGSIRITPPTLQSKTSLINGHMTISWNVFELIYIKPFEVEDDAYFNSRMNKKDLELISFNTELLSAQLELYFNNFL